MNHPNQFIIFMIAILLQGQIGDYFYVQSNLHMPKLIDSNQIFKFDTTSAISIDFNSTLFINTHFFGSLQIQRWENLHVHRRSVCECEPIPGHQHLQCRIHQQVQR